MPDHACFATRTRFHHRQFRPAVLALAVASAFAVQPAKLQAQTLPTGGVAVHGQAAISNPSPNQLRVVTQNGAGTNHSAINWQSFSIAPGASTNFVQPSANSLSINRVVTNTPSSIFGALSSNGRLVLVNQSGIAVGAGAVIDTAGFTASALRMSDADALAGRLRFGDANASMGGAGGITVGGRITARDGDVVLVAPNIELGASALVQAPNGSTILAAGQQVEITGRGLEGITLLVQAPSNQVRNLGRLEGSAVGIFAGTLRHSGEIQATTASLEGGRVVLKASGDAYVEGAGKVLATGSKGGRIDVLGQRVAVMDQAVVDASGAQGGGTVRVGGDYQGKNPDLPNAAMAYVGPEAQVLASSTAQGDGGKVIVWADGVARAYGRIAADGGPAGGAGGLVETSGKHYLDVGGSRVTASSTDGRPGTWLLDPGDINVLSGSNGANVALTGASPFQPVSSSSFANVTDGTLSAALDAQTNVVLTTTNAGADGSAQGNIIFNAALNGNIIIERTVSTSLATLDIQAANNIIFSGGATTFRQFASGGQGLAVNLSAGGSSVVDAGGQLILDSTNGNTVELVVKGGKTLTNNGTLSLNGASSVRLPNESGYATLQNASGGTVNINSTANWSFLSDSGVQGGIVNNDGVVNVLLPSAASTSWEAVYNQGSGGNLSIAAGKSVSMQNAGNVGGQINFAAGSSLVLSEQHGGALAIAANFSSGLGQLTVASGVTATFANPTGVLGQFLLDGSAVLQSGTLATDVYSQSSSASLTGAGNLTVTSAFNDGGGFFNPTGALDITQGSGTLNFGRNLSLASFELRANADLTLSGNISTSGPLLLSSLTGSLAVAGNLAGNVLTLNAGTTLDINANITAHDLNMTAGGAITQNAGTLTSTGFAIINATAGPINVTNARPITLNSAGNNFQFVSTNGSNVSLTDADFVILSSSAVFGNYSVASQGDITQQAGSDLQIVGHSTFASAAGKIYLLSSSIVNGALLNDFSSITVTGGGVTGGITVSDKNDLVVTAFTRNVPTANLYFVTGGALTLPAGDINVGTADLKFQYGGAFTTPGDLTGNSLELSGSGALTLAHNISMTGFLFLQGSSIAQTAGAVVVGGPTLLNVPGGTVSLARSGNDFSSIYGSTGALTVVDINSLAVSASSFNSKSGINSNNGNVTLSATGSGAITLSGPIDAGTGQINISSSADILGVGALSGSNIAIQTQAGLDLLTNITATGTLLLATNAGSGITQSGGSIVVGGLTTATAGSLPITLTQPGNDFSSFAATGTAISVRDTNALNLGAINGATSLNVQTNGNLTQSAPLVVSGAASFNAGTGGISLPNFANDFGSAQLAGGDIFVVVNNGLLVNGLTRNVPDANLHLQARFGSLTFSGVGAIDTGAGTLSLDSGGTLTTPGALSGSGMYLRGAFGLTLTDNISTPGSLELNADNFINQTGGVITVGGPTFGGGLPGSTAITMNNAANDFASVGLTGSTIQLRDSNAIVLGAMQAGTSLNVVAGGNVTQSAPLVISGTTSITSAGNVTLTTPGNNLNSLSINANAINVVEGAGNSLTVTSLASGVNQPVSLAAGHTLTLPGTPIDTGTADLSLFSAVGSLTVPAALSGNNISLGAVTGLTVNAPVNAAGNFNASVSNAASVTTINADVLAGGTMTLNLAGGLELPAVNLSARLGAGTGQTINAKYVALTVTGSGTSEIFNLAGPQTITTSGMNGAGEGLVVRNTGTGADTAGIYNAAGLQTITVNNADVVRVAATSGEAFIHSDGGQTLVLQGASSANTLLVGIGGATHTAEIRGNNQSIVAGQPGQAGAITVVGGSTNDFDSGFANDSGTQTIKTSGQLALFGGSAPGGAGVDCLAAGGGTHVGSCGFIAQQGTGLQTLSASSMQLLGGGSGSSNLAVIASQNASQQLIEITGGGSLALLGGSGSGSGNKALIASTGPLQTVNFLSGGVLAVVGGTVGSQHSAGVFSNGAASTQTFSGATGIQLSGGASGGGLGAGNFASLRAAGSQSITVGNGGISMVGGGGSLTGNYANIEQIGGAGTSQSITINGTGSITLQGGSSAGTGVAGGSGASIRSGGDSQTILFTGTGIGRAIDITGGTVGADAYAEIYAGAGSQSIVGAGLITLTGGASGGGASFGGDDTLGNLASIAADINHQTITASGLVLQGGAGGLNNFALVYGGGNQAITVGASGLQLLGGGGGALDAKNAALVLKGNDVPATSQTITVGGGGAILLQGGNAIASNVGLDANLRNFSNGAFAAIRSEGVAQLIEFAAPGGSIQLTGGTLGSDNHAMIVAQSGTQTIRGSSAANAPGLALSGGASGGVGGAANEGNRALVLSLAGNQSVTASSISLAGGAAGNENRAHIRQGDASNGLSSTQAMTIVGGGSVAMQGGGGNTNFARIQSFGTTQSLTYSAGGSLNLTGGTGASLDFASINAVNGNQNILGSPNIAVTGGASGGADLNGNFASITANSATATQTIVSSAMTLNAGAGGTNNLAVLLAPVQNITVHGNLAMTGGGSATSLDGTTGGGTRIGESGGATGSAVTLVVDNNITLTGGSVGGAAIGNSIQGGTTTSINITAGGNVTLNPGTAATAGVRFGSPVVNTAAGDIVVVAGGAITLNGTVAGETSVRTLGKVRLEGNTLAIGNAVTGSEVDLHGLAGVSLSGVAAVSATATSGNSLDVVVDSGAFSNTAGAGALNAAAGGRWLVYSVNPVNDTRGGLIPAFKQYGAVSGSTVLGTGNGFLYSVVPSATASLVGPITKTYDGSLVATLTGANYSVTGIDGDVVVLNNPSTGIFDTKDFGTGKTVTSGASSVVSASNGAATVFGYNPLVAPATGAVGSIGAASLLLTTSAVTKIYDGNTSALGTAIVSSGALIGADTLGGGSFAFLDPNAGANKAVTVSGVTVNDGNGGANYSVSYVNNATSTVNPFAVKLMGSRSYDGTTAVNAAVLTVGALVGTQTLNLSGAGTMATKHVGTGKTLGLGTLALADGSGLASNYTFTGGTQAVNITQAPLTLSAANVTKTYDGGVSAAGVATVVGGTGTGSTLFAGDTLGTSGLAFADKNVGIGNKTVIVSAGAVIDGNSGANYNLTMVDNTTSTINPFVVNLTGSRDYNGLATVVAGALVTGTLAGSETLTLSGVGSVSGKNVGNAYPVALGTLALADGSNGGLASNYTLAGGTRTVDITRLASVTWTGSVDNLWSTPGNWVGGAVPDGANVAAVVINTGSGDITHDVTGVNINSLNSTRRVVQSTGSFGTATLPAQLVVTTTGGVALDNPGNRIATLSVSNSGSGDVSVQNTGVLNVAGLTNTAGGITLVNTGAITTTGAVSAAVGNISITANSPLTVGSSGVTADVGSVSLSANNSDGNMTLDGPITAGTAVLLDAGATLTQNSAVVGPTGVTANAGVGPMVFGPSATTTSGGPINYMVNNVAAPAPPTELFTQTQAQSEAVDTLVTFLDLFEAAVEEQVAEKSLGTNSDDTKKKKAEDTIVTEGEVCR